MPLGLTKQELDEMFLESFMDIHNQKVADIKKQNPYADMPKAIG